LAQRGSASVSATASRSWWQTPTGCPHTYRISAATDPSAHRNDPEQVIRIVSSFLHRTPSGGIPRQIHYQADEISGFGNYRTFVWCVAEILRRPNRADKD